MSKTWLSLLFETCELGVSSAVAPELLPDNQVAWGMNIDVRGGKAATRPNLRCLGNLPVGLIQGGEYFGVQGGMLVVSIAGRIYRLRIGQNDMQVEEIPLTFRNSSLQKQVWMTQTVESLVIQDGQSDAILYNGSTAPRAGPTQVPRGRQMAYGNGRLWVAVDTNNALAGDIRTNAAGSELEFTEATYLSGGGKLFFNSPITGMAFIPVTGQADYGALLVYGARETNAIRADITARDDWGKIPGFETAILRSVGASSQWSLVAINQDLYWRDSNGGIRSIRNALADEAGPGSAPISREVSRLTDYDSEQLLGFCSGVYFENRLLMTSSPFLMQNGGVGWKNIIPLDFAPLSTMGGKSQPAYDGKWNGLNFVKLMGGQFNGKNRAFAMTTDDGGNNQLWEFDSGDRADLYDVCTDGTADVLENPISCFIEYPLRDFGQSKSRKRLARCDVWLSSVNGEVDLKVYWRSDNSVKWLLWDEATTCAKTSDSATTTPHVWKNLIAQERPQFKTFTIPDDVNDVVKYAAQVGFEFQIRLAWTGRARIHRVMLHAEQLDDPDYADRAGFEAQCIQDDVTGNQINYEIPTDGCPAFVITYDNGGGPTPLPPGTVVNMGNGGTDPVSTVFTICNTGVSPIKDFSVAIYSLCPGKYVVTVPPPQTIPVGECASYTITFYPLVECPGSSTNGVVDVKTGDNTISQFTVDDGDGQKPNITEEPEDACVAPDGSTSFSLHATHGPLEYDWFVSDDAGSTWTEIEDVTPYSGANTSELTIDPAASDMDNLMYYCRVRNPHGHVDSDEVLLTVGSCTNAFLEVGAGMFDFPVTPFADCASAYVVMSDSLQVSNCVGYFQNEITPLTASAVSSANKLTMDQTYSTLWEVAFWSSLNLVSGQTLNIAWTGTASGGVPGVDEWGFLYYIYDDEGNVVDNDFLGSTEEGSFQFVVPSTGTYRLFCYFSACVASGSCGWSHMHLELTAPSLTVNPVRANYGPDPENPSHLNCGDSC